MKESIDLFEIGDLILYSYMRIKEDKVNYSEKLPAIGFLLQFMSVDNSSFKTVNYIRKNRKLQFSDLGMKTENEFGFLKQIKDFNANMLIKLSSEIFHGIEIGELENKCNDIIQEFN